MKKIKLLMGGLTCLAISLSACKKNKDVSSATNELEKIESLWDGISQKNHNDVSTPKVETKASDQWLQSVRSSIQKRYNDYMAANSQKPHTELLGNWVGVIKSTPGGSCNGYDVLRIFMDCEDNNPKTTYMFGSFRPDWVVDGNLNMGFCIVPGNDFHGFGEFSGNSYAVLRVTTQEFRDAWEIGRHFDNEDNRNANSATLQCGPIRTPGRNGQAINVFNNTSNNDNSIYATLVGGNTDLSLHVFGNPIDPTFPLMTSFPVLNGLSYGVFGIPTLRLDHAAIFVDDEDSRNASSWYTNDVQYGGSFPDAFAKGTSENNNIMYAAEYAGGFFTRGGQNTEMNISKVR